MIPSRFFGFGLGLLLVIASFANQGSAHTPSPNKAQRVPIVIAHRGASGLYPEHTLEAYQKAIEFGADFIEPDLVFTKDGYFVARHDVEISTTTNARENYPQLWTTKRIDGKNAEGIFIDDLTLAEVKSLKAKQRVPTRDQSLNGLFDIPTFDEIIELVRNQSLLHHRTIGIYVELKHPTYFSLEGFKMGDALLAKLAQYKLNSKSAPVIIQCFEPSTLRALASKTTVRTMQLIGELQAVPWDLAFEGKTHSYGYMLTNKGLKEVAKYAMAIGPGKEQIVSFKTDSHNVDHPQITQLVQRAHQNGLEVHAYTFKREAIPSYFKNDLITEIKFMFEIGVDAVFSDYSLEAVKAKEAYLQK